MPPRAGGKLGGSPRREWPEAMFGVLRVRARMSRTNSRDLFIAIYHLFPGDGDANYRRWPPNERSLA